MNNYQLIFTFKPNTVATPLFWEMLGREITNVTGSKTERHSHHVSHCGAYIVENCSFNSEDLKQFLLAAFNTYGFSLLVRKA